MATTLAVTFTFPNDEESALKLTMPESALREHDPKGESLLSAKLRFEGLNLQNGGTVSMTMEATGPGNDEYCVPELIKFVWEYISSGCLEVTPGLEGSDCERALEYWGFPKLEVKIPASDPRRIGKQIAYRQHREAMSKSPKIVKFVEDELLKPCVGPAGVMLVVDDTPSHHNQYYETVDLPIQSAKNKNGAIVGRFGARHGIETLDQKAAMTLLGGSDKTCTALRASVLEQTNALGGVKAEWTWQYLQIQDVGEHGNHEYVCEFRHVLTVALDRSGEQDSIKRRKTN